MRRRRVNLCAEGKGFLRVRRNRFRTPGNRACRWISGCAGIHGFHIGKKMLRNTIDNRDIRRGCIPVITNDDAVDEKLSRRYRIAPIGFRDAREEWKRRHGCWFRCR